MLAPAKINLFLHVAAPDANGYHPLQSLVAFADIGDEVELFPVGSVGYAADLNPRLSVDGPFAATKDMLAGFNLIEAADLAEAVRIASEFPWTRTGSIEVRPVREMAAVRRRVSA